MRRRGVRSPLPQRDGVDAARVRLPVSSRWSTVYGHLVERLPVPVERVREMVAAGEVWSLEGPVSLSTPYVPGGSVWFHRPLPTEVRVPFEVGVVYRDENIVVVDKPHFLATTPRGSHVRETALVRARVLTGLPDLSPAHRLDRMTAGLLVFVVRPEVRSAYQGLFARREVRKEYTAVARLSPGVAVPGPGAVVRSRIVKERGVLAAFEVPGEVNAVTRVAAVECRGALVRFDLRPETGQTHQLRVHLSRLGLPVVNDDLFPVVVDRSPGDFTAPLQLLARSVGFRDPVSGVDRVFVSGLSLESWPG